MSALKTIVHYADFCVVGGGLAGLCAAVAAARHGARVVLMQDRPMLGGNASSEVRMWISGANGWDNRETGLLEELTLENQYRNPLKNYSIWDSVLYGMARGEKNLTLLLNCSCLDAAVEQGRIQSVTGWQTTTQRFQRVVAPLFADCSGDSILAPLTGAAYRQGREAAREFGEHIAPENADRKTMGMSCLMQARELDGDTPFIAPAWAEKVRTEQLHYREPDMTDVRENFWYLELGGDRDSIGDTEQLRDELVPLAYGMWDYLKNDPSQCEKNRHWALDWVGMLPGKRESRRYVGPCIVTEHDVLAGGPFRDMVAYGGWTMDDHHPSGFRTSEPPNIFHPAPSPFGLPYRCLYSANVPNLFFAGRNISVTHTAFSAVRVMATCALCGQAVGTAAALAAQLHGDPADVAVAELQACLMEDDCYLPGFRRKIAPLTLVGEMTVNGVPVPALTDGVDRALGEETHQWRGKPGEYVCLRWSAPIHAGSLRLVFDSDLNRDTLTAAERAIDNCMYCNIHRNMLPAYPPPTLIRSFDVTLMYADGHTETLVRERNNYQRLRRYALERTDVTGLIFEPLTTWGAEDFRLFALEVQPSRKECRS